MPDLESRLLRIETEQQCAALIIRYAHLMDACDWEGAAALYMEDGRMNRPSVPDDFVQGRAAILAAFRARPPRIARHVSCNIVVTQQGPDQASAFSQILLFTGTAAENSGLPIQSAAPPMVGSYRDQMIRTADGWRFVERCGSMDFRLP